MVINSKDKGNRGEHDVVEILSKLVDKSSFKRVYASGGVGTYVGVPLLTGDINGEIKGFSKKFKIEVKTGYSGNLANAAKSMTIKKEWLDKVAEEAKNAYAIPFLVAKFDGVREGVKFFVCIDVNVFADLLNETTALRHELDLIYEERKRNGQST